MTQYYQTDQIRALEQVAAQQYQLTEDDLMGNAGQAAWEILQRHWPQAEHILVVCGAGNNGGDGYVLARLAAEAEKNVVLLTLGDHDKLSPVADRARLACAEQGVVGRAFSSQALFQADVIVDAIFGIGLTRSIEGVWREAVDAINACSAPVLALDVPSGLDADTGKIHGVCVQADRTLSFLGAKPGLVTGEGANYAGIVQVDTLGLPALAFKQCKGVMQQLQLDTLLLDLKSRKPNSHKGDYGHVLVVGGDVGMGGAVRLAAEAALRVGAGLVTVATRKENTAIVSGARPEIMTHAIEDAAALQPLIQRASTLVLGPGLGQTTWSEALFKACIATDKTMLVDADGLNFLAKTPEQRSNWVLTPHPGEAGRLLGCSTDSVQQDRLAAVCQLQQRFGGVVILKGAGSLLKAERERLAVCIDGDPGMASGGMGDLLSGIIGGLLAQRFPLAYAVKLGVCLHACAGKRVARSTGQRGMVALDLLPEVRALLNSKLAI